MAADTSDVGLSLRVPSDDHGGLIEGDGVLNDSAALDVPPSQRRRLDEDGEAAPASQDSDLAERTRKLRVSVEDPRGQLAAVVEVSADQVLATASTRRPSLQGPRAPVVSAAPYPTAGVGFGVQLRAAASSSSVPMPEARSANPPTEVAGPSPFRHGRVWCCWCHDKSFASPQGFMRHLTTMHAGEEVDMPMRDTLVAMQRCVCTDVTCGGFRRVGARKCNRCGMNTPARPPALGDRIAGPVTPGGIPGAASLSGSLQGATDAAPPAFTGAPSSAAQFRHADDPDAEPLILPGDWTARIRTLSSNARRSHQPTRKGTAHHPAVLEPGCRWLCEIQQARGGALQTTVCPHA